MNKRVGSYRLGFEWVELRLAGVHSGQFFLNPHQGETGFIQVGHYDGHYSLLLPTLLHELLEYAACRTMARFAAAPSASRSSSGYLFVMDHEKFAEIVQQAAEYMAACEKDLKKVLAEVRKELKAKSKPKTKIEDEPDS